MAREARLASPSSSNGGGNGQATRLFSINSEFAESAPEMTAGHSGADSASSAVYVTAAGGPSTRPHH
ncbi:hypothetical protein PC129_g20115 [Phytophthora cactorum]|uniref:Uncharacterized protein n=1 Tax=Phytophthora cactorum TaxID=29920 RepID=A0A329RHV0_9STRA|nr:hypothetical protein Pcac1_g5330 [Phytophthora cactorum]KAG2799541.1 hypothetical protein PC111_g20379 [Phytophthora cactorum]KAG2801233.1 hypothetical protein PC112_g20125 [Phytophthora cactorum]KAG2836511.1 hypothetical protein PC113_g20013 [Phytophthora cactorum]KAG2879157.1 hypothetical protein PC114_g22712 [Phytophthora cactorum]